MNDEGTYGKTMVFESFFNSPTLPKDQIGGWLFRGHDKNDEYQEFVVLGAECDPVNYPDDWIDWCRIPIARGSALLARHE